MKSTSIHPEADSKPLAASSLETHPGQETFSGLTLHGLECAAQTLSIAYAHIPIWLLTGPMGAGKTTLVQALCRAWGIPGPVQSPTFGLVNPHRAPDGSEVYHVDAYRLSGPEEAYEAGILELILEANDCQGPVCKVLIEWPDRLGSLVPAEALHLELSIDNEQDTGFEDEAPATRTLRIWSTFAML